MGGGPNLQEEVPVACEPAAQWYGSREHQKTHLAVLPAQDGALPDPAISQLDKELPHPAMLVVSLPNTDPGPPLQGVPGMESAAEDSVGGPEEGDGEVEGTVEGTGLTGRRRCSRAVLDFLLTTDVGRRVPALEDDTVSVVSELEVREVGGAGSGGRGVRH